MDHLRQIIRSLRKEEIRHFKLFARRSHGQQARKDLALFDMMRKNMQASDDVELRSDPQISLKANAFYRLRHRLLEELNKSLYLQHFDKDAESADLYLYSLARLHVEAKRSQVAYHYLRRAEREAVRHENFKVLDLIYSLYIRLSSNMFAINPERYIQLRQENRKKIRALDVIDDTLAAVMYRIRNAHHYGGRDDRILQLLDDTVREYAMDEQLIQSPRLRIKLFEAVSSVLLQRNEFGALEVYLKETYASFLRENLFNKQNHNIHLRMLTYLVNTLQVNQKYEESLGYADKLKTAMHAYKDMLYDRYVAFYYNSLAVNYSIVDGDKAIGLLLELKENPSLKSRSFNPSFIFTNLAVLFFNSQKYRNALRSLVELYLLDEFKEVDPELKLRIAMLELATRYELEENEYLLSRIQQVGKLFEKLLEKDAHLKDLNFLKVLEKMNQSAFEVGKSKKEKLADEIAVFLHEWAENNKDGQEPIFDYDEWLSVKLESPG